MGLFRRLRAVGLALALLAVPATAGAQTFADGLAAAEAGDFATAMTLWRPLAEAGDHDAQYGIGRLYRDGLGVAADPLRAFPWFQKAAEAGHVGAAFSLAAMYDAGDGVAQDLATAAAWYTRAAEGGLAEARYNLGFMYERGEGVAQDPRKAADWFRMAAEQGHAEAQNDLGVLYAEGRGVKRDFDKAFSWIMKSNVSNEALLIYQYRGKMPSSPSDLRTDDQTPIPVPDVRDKVPGRDYVVQTMVRRKSDPKFKDDLTAIEGGVYLVKCTQLVFDTTAGSLTLGKPGEIRDPKGSVVAKNADEFPEAVIAFTADFYNLPARSAGFFDSANGFGKSFTNAKNPVFTRNLAVRR